MPVLNIQGRRVTVGDEFLSLSPEDQDRMVDEIGRDIFGPKEQGKLPQAGGVLSVLEQMVNPPGSSQREYPIPNVAAKESQLVGTKPFPEVSRAGMAEGAYAGPETAGPQPGFFSRAEAPYGQLRRGGLTDIAVHGAALGYGPEIQAGLGALTGQGTYRQLLEEREGELEEARRDYPVLAPAAEITGGFAGAGAPLARAVTAQGLSIGQRILRGLGGGGLFGGIAGAGEGLTPEQRGAMPEGPTVTADIAARARGAAGGALAGAATGGAISTALPVVSALGRRAYTMVRPLARQQTFAAAKVAEAAAKDRLTAQRLETSLRVGQAISPETRLIDVGGPAMRELGRAATNISSKAGSQFRADIGRRQARQFERLSEDVSDALGDASQFYQTNDALVAQRRATAEPLWAQAYATPTPYTRQLESVLQRPAMQQLMGRARTAALNRGEDFQGFFAREVSPGQWQIVQVPQTRDLHRMRQHINQAIDDLTRGRETGMTATNLRDLQILKRDFDQAVENPVYKQAIEQFADDSAPINALNEGLERGMQMQPEEIQRTLRDLGPADAAMWRRGFARAIVNRLREGGRLGTNRAEVLRSPKFDARMIAAFPDKAARARFRRQLELETRFARTRHAIEGGPTTARQLAEGAEAGVQAEADDQLIQTAGRIAAGDFGGALAQLLARARNVYTGLLPKTADEIVRLLASRRPADVARARLLIDQAQRRLERRTAAGGAVRGFGTAGGVLAAEETRRRLSETP